MTWPEVPNYYEAPNAAYKVVLQQPTHPVVSPDPTFGQVGASLLAGDCCWLVGTRLTILPHSDKHEA